MIRGKLFIISGPSGTGKTTLINALLNDRDCKSIISKVITYTTRPRRNYEVDGIDYHFISQNEFKEKIKSHYFLEFSTWYDYYYGTSSDIIKSLEKGNSFIMIIDRMGAREMVRLYSKTITIWLSVSSINILRNRLLLRNTENENSIKNRLEKAICEQQEEDSQKFYKYHIIQDDFNKSLQLIKDIIYKEL